VLSVVKQLLQAMPPVTARLTLSAHRLLAKTTEVCFYRQLTVRQAAEYELLGYNYDDNDHDGGGDYDSSRPVISHIYRASHLRGITEEKE
jgi:hypothetical protein